MSREDECDPECVSNIIQLWIEGILIPTIAVFGILGNIFCLFVLSSKSVELKPSFANLLKCLSVYDIALLVSCWLLFYLLTDMATGQAGMLLLYSLPCLSPQYHLEAKPRLIPYILPLTQVQAGPLQVRDEGRDSDSLMP